MAGKACVTFLITVALAAFSPAQNFTTLKSFTGGSDGSFPLAGLIQDSAGNLYSTTDSGGDVTGDCAPYGCGLVYRLNPDGTETVLHTFEDSDGAGPSAPVTRDKQGNIYGTTTGGGSGNGSHGTVFRISPAGKETLYSFIGGTDGCTPYQGVIVGEAGNLYGTTLSCGSSRGYGTIFKIDAAGRFTLLHSFAGSDGANPQYGHLTMDNAGNLYGVANFGGARNSGVVYELSSSGKYTVLYSFKGGADGWGPLGTVLRDNAGNLYGTTALGGPGNNGTIWKVTPAGQESILHTFGGPVGCAPSGGLTPDSQGNLYGVTSNCGSSNEGVLYKLSRDRTLTVLHSFAGSGGALPFGEVLRTSTGRLYGTTGDGGADNNGTIWSYLP